MAYREHRSEPEPIARFWYGPFLPAAPQWLFLLVLAILVVAFGEAGFGSRGITCEAGRCAWIAQSPFLGSQRREFAAADVGEVRFVRGLGKSNSDAESVLVFRSGHELRLGRDSEAKAQSFHAVLERHFAETPEAKLDLVSRPSGVIAAISVLVLLALGVQLVRLLVMARPWRVSVWRGRVLLRRWPRGESREIEIGEARRIVVADTITIEHARGKSALPPGPRKPGRAGRLAARKLAGVLGVPGPELPGRAAKRSWPRPRISHGVGLVFVLSTATVAVIRNCTSYMQRDEGTLVLECRGRCRFQGAECLPGGSVQMTLPPGTHGIDVWDPDAPGHWTARKFSIEVGETTRFVCPTER